MNQGLHSIPYYTMGYVLYFSQFITTIISIKVFLQYHIYI